MITITEMYKLLVNGEFSKLIDKGVFMNDTLGSYSSVFIKECLGKVYGQMCNNFSDKIASIWLGPLIKEFRKVNMPINRRTIQGTVLSSQYDLMSMIKDSKVRCSEKLAELFKNGIDNIGLFPLEYFKSFSEEYRNYLNNEILKDGKLIGSREFDKIVSCSKRLGIDWNLCKGSIKTIQRLLPTYDLEIILRSTSEVNEII